MLWAPSPPHHPCCSDLAGPESADNSPRTPETAPTGRHGRRQELQAQWSAYWGWGEEGISPGSKAILMKPAPQGPHCMGAGGGGRAIGSSPGGCPSGALVWVRLWALESGCPESTPAPASYQVGLQVSLVPSPSLHFPFYKMGMILLPRSVVLNQCSTPFGYHMGRRSCWWPKAQGQDAANIP